MDFTVWTQIIAPLALMIFVIYVIIAANRAAKELEQQKSKKDNQTGTPTSGEDVFQSFSQNTEEFPSKTELEQENAETTDAHLLMAAAQSEPETVQVPPVPVDSRTPLPTKSVPATSLIDPSPETFREGIILAEILGRPKGLRHRP